MLKEFCSEVVSHEKDVRMSLKKKKEEGQRHDLAEKTYKTVTKCDFCKKTLWGVRKQVLLSAYFCKNKFSIFK